MPKGIIVCLLFALTGCTTASSGPPTASGSTTPTPTVTAVATTNAPLVMRSVPALPLVVAAADKHGGLALYAVAPMSHAAVLLHRLESPANRVVAAVSLSGGAAPVVCAVWREEPVNTDASQELRCYRPGDTQGRVTARTVGMAVGVRADGRALAWTDNGGGENQTLLVADLAGDVATVRTRAKYAPDLGPGQPALEGLVDLDWLGPRLLAATTGAQDDEGRGLCIVDLDHPRQHAGPGFGRCFNPGPAEQRRGFAHFEQAVRVADGVVVAIERPLTCCSDPGPGIPGGRAVRFRVSDGAVLGVLATPRPGRDVIDVSGGLRALLYTTAQNSREHLAVYLRWQGEKSGALLTGLPADVSLATAQP